MDDFFIFALYRAVSVCAYRNSPLALREQKRNSATTQKLNKEACVLTFRAANIGAQVLIFIALLLPLGSKHAAEPELPPKAADSVSDVLSGFNKDQDKPSDIVSIPDKKKRLIMFLMGVPLLIFILLTAALGIAMGMYGKPVFVPHMVCAGLSVTLAIAHAIVGIVWFYPF